jgi:PilZ domain-containing protein
MPQDQALNGRMERRLPIIVVVSLAQIERPIAEGIEWTYTDNISAHGARVFSKRSWRPGEEISVTPLNEEPTSGNVVYCEKQADDRHFIGVRFKENQNMWSAIKRYDGVQLPATLKAISS